MRQHMGERLKQYRDRLEILTVRTGPTGMAGQFATAFAVCCVLA